MKDAKPTVSLHIIVKDEVERVAEIISDDATIFFDDIYLTFSDMTAYRQMLDKVSAVMWKNVHVDYRPWSDRFDEARNHNFALGDSTYQFWIDSDDTFDFRRVKQLVEIAEDGGLDTIFLPYNYAQDDQGRCIVRHWRERLLRRSSGFEWRGWVHETAIVDRPVKSEMIDIEVTHHTSPDHAQNSTARNHDILLKAWEATDDERYLHYLGMSYFTAGDYEEAITLLGEYLTKGANVEDMYRSMSLISEASYHLRRYDFALEYASKCAVLKPEYPMAYWLLAQYEADQENWKEALEWVKTSLSKPDPSSLTIWDPTARERAILIAAQADFMLNNYNRALGWLRKIPNNETAQDLTEHFTTEADLETFFSLVPKIRGFFNSDKELFNALEDEVKYDTRIKALRQATTTPKTWGDKSIVIFCGQGYEEWGPNTMDKGMGGSEEAIVYLAPELAKLGYAVTIFGEANYIQAQDDGGIVDWIPWKQIDTRDNFNIFISWRAPQYLERVNAKVKLADIHDVLPPEIMKDYPDVTYLVKTAYHRSLTPDLPDEKFRIIGNGISKKQFKEN